MPTAAQKRFVLEVLKTSANDTGLPNAEFRELLARLSDDGYTTSELLLTYEGGAFQKVPPEATAMRKLQVHLTAARAGRAPLVDDARMQLTIEKVIKKCLADVAQYHTKPSGDGAIGDRQRGDEAYKLTKQLQGLDVPLEMRVSFVGAMVKELADVGYIQMAPGLDGICLLGNTRSKKGSIKLAESDMSIAVNEDRYETVLTIGRCHSLTYAYVYGLLSVLGRKISDTAYDKRDVGWILVPGEATQVRVGMTRAKAEELIRYIVQVGGTEVAPYIEMFNGVIRAFIQDYSRKLRHADEGVDDLLFNRPALFKVAATASEGLSTQETTVGSPLVEKPEKGSAEERSRRGVCQAWLTSGNCQAYFNGDCPYGHAESHRGVLHGRGNGGRGGGYRNQGSQGQWGWNSNGWQGGGKGGGKGGKGGWNNQNYQNYQNQQWDWNGWQYVGNSQGGGKGNGQGWSNNSNGGRNGKGKRKRNGP